MSKQRKERTSRAARRSPQPSRSRWWIGISGAILVVVAGFVLWQAQGEKSATPVLSDALPTPIGFPDTAQDVGTMEGRIAPVFTLADETGQLVTVDITEAKQPIVLVFNMGLG